MVRFLAPKTNEFFFDSRVFWGFLSRRTRTLLTSPHLKVNPGVFKLSFGFGSLALVKPILRESCLTAIVARFISASIFPVYGILVLAIWFFRVPRRWCGLAISQLLPI